MSERSMETNNLLNPAFCGLVYASIVEGFNSKSITTIPFYLPYILMPIVLHKESRLQIPSTTATKFHSWIQNAEQIKIGLPERARSLKPFVSEAATFLHGQGHIESDETLGIKIKELRKMKKIISESEATTEYTRKAKILGAICGKNNSDLSILALLGVQL
jgi:hypothetical protein